jgi:hypothetical protein
MVSSGMLRRVALLRVDVSEELSNPTLLSLLPLTPLCILNSEFHSSFLSHLVFLRSMCRLLVTANVVPSSPIVTLMMEALSSSETSVLIRVTRHNIQEDTILHSHRRENPKFYPSTYSFIFSCRCLEGNMLVSNGNSTLETVILGYHVVANDT